MSVEKREVAIQLTYSNTSSLIRNFVNSDESCRELEHILDLVKVVSELYKLIEQLETHVAKRDDDELSILCSIFDVVGDNRYVPEIESSIDFVHEVERCRLGTKAKSQIRRENQESKTKLTLYTWRAKTRASEERVFSPPERFEIFFQLFFGGMTEKRIPSENGSAES